MTKIVFRIDKLEGCWKVSGDTMRKPTYPTSRARAGARVVKEMLRATEGDLVIEVSSNGKKE